LTLVTLGEATGPAIDALLTHRQVIYRKTGNEKRVTVSPLFGHGRRGAAIRLQF
jgi:hypothetical protein